MGFARLFSIAGLVLAWGLLQAPYQVARGAEGAEPYSSRPSVLAVKPQTHSDLGSDWEKLKRGHIEAVAQLLELYPDREIYFLARDSELLYDLAKHATQGEPPVHARIHLLNISRANMTADHVKDYLSQEGISEAALKAGKQVLFVDTGFSGTIPKVISELFPAKLRKNFQTHLMSSSNLDHPSSRVFLAAINPAVNLSGPASMHGTVVGYEHMPRYTNRSDHFERVKGRWEPISNEGDTTDGNVSKEKAIAYQQDLIAYANEEPQKALLKQRREQWRKLMKAKGAGQLAVLKSLLKDGDAKNPFPEAMVRDWLDVTKKNLKELHGSKLKLEQLNIQPEQLSGEVSNKMFLIKKYPQWAEVLKDPEGVIPKFMKQNQWSMLGAISDVIQDDEFVFLLAKSLGENAPSQEAKNFARALIEKGNYNVLQSLIAGTFSNPKSAPWEDLVIQLINTGTAAVQEDLAFHAFSKPHAAAWKKSATLLVEKGSPDSIDHLIVKAFSKPHSSEWKDLLEKIIAKNQVRSLELIAQFAFFDPRAAEWKDLVSLLIENEKSGFWAQKQLIDKVFSRPFSVGLEDQLTQLVLKAKPNTFYWLETWVLNLPHWDTPVGRVLSKAVKITDAADRKKFVESKLKNSSVVNLGAGRELKVGERVRTLDGHEFEVTETVEAGKRGMVYRVKDAKTKKEYALKVAVDSKAETLNSIGSEAKKAEAYAKLKLPHAKVIEAQSEYVLKEWVEGQRADVWVKEWESLAASKRNTQQLQSLQKMVKKLSDQGAYVGDLNAKNLIWDGKRWVVVDSGSIREGLEPEEALAEFSEKLSRRWAKGAKHPEKVSSCLKAALESL